MGLCLGSPYLNTNVLIKTLLNIDFIVFLYYYSTLNLLTNGANIIQLKT